MPEISRELFELGGNRFGYQHIIDKSGLYRRERHLGPLGALIT